MRHMLASLLVMIALASTGDATSYLEPTRTAPATGKLVVDGTVRAVTPMRMNGRVVSRVLVWNGTTELPILVPGGALDGIAVHVSGVPDFAVGDVVRVNVRATRSGLHLVDLGAGAP
jgi:hypothetical protein